MALPLPRVIPDVGPGGGLVTAMRGINALREDILKNKYYGPNIQSEIDNRNASTQGININNEYLPEKLRLANALANLHNKYYGPNIQSEIDNRNASTQGININNEYLPEKLKQLNQIRQFGINNPLLHMPGAAGQVGALSYMRNNPNLFGNSMNSQSGEQYLPGNGNPPTSSGQSSNNLSDLLQSSIENELRPKGNSPTKEFKNAQAFQDASDGFVPFTNRTQTINNDAQKQNYITALRSSDSHKAIEEHQRQSLGRKHWDGLTPDTKAHLVAIGQGAGIRGDQVEKAISSGQDFDTLLYDHGYSPDSPPDPIYELTNANRKALSEREYASREIKYLSNFINKSTGDYAYKVKSFSPEQVKDALLGKNDEQQASYLAARALSPELINLRLVLGAAKPTVHAIKAMGDKSMLNSKIFESLVSGKVWHRAQEIQDEQLQKAFSASKKGYGQPNNKSIDKSKKPDFKKMTDAELRKYIGE